MCGVKFFFDVPAKTCENATSRGRGSTAAHCLYLLLTGPNLLLNWTVRLFYALKASYAQDNKRRSRPDPKGHT